MNSFRLLLPVLALLLMGQGCIEVYNPSAEPAPEPEQEELQEEMTNDDSLEMEEDADANEEASEEVEEENVDDVLTLEAALEDVTGGNASGTAIATYSDGTYSLNATFENLLDPDEGYFYEGWIVRTDGELSVLTTGALEQVDGKWVNIFTAERDLTDHNQYVLTIEPDDGNPLPAGHVVEGEFVE